MSYENIPTAIFCQPNAATVGLTEARAREKYEDIEIYIERLRPMKHTISGSDEKFMMATKDKASDQILGVHMVGADAGEIVQGPAVAKKIESTNYFRRYCGHSSYDRRRIRDDAKCLQKLKMKASLV